MDRTELVLVLPFCFVCVMSKINFLRLCHRQQLSIYHLPTRMRVYMDFIENLCKIDYNRNQPYVGGFRGWQQWEGGWCLGPPASALRVFHCKHTLKILPNTGNSPPSPSTCIQTSFKWISYVNVGQFSVRIKLLTCHRCQTVRPTVTLCNAISCIFHPFW